MKKKACYILCCLVIFACQSIDKPRPPQNLIPENKMVDILTDTYLSNAARGVNNRMIREKGYKLDKTLYKTYAIDSVQFIESNAYYASNLEQYATIIEKVTARLELLKKESDSLKFEYTEKIRIKDSLKRDSIARKLRKEDTIKEKVTNDSVEKKSTKIKSTTLKTTDS